MRRLAMISLLLMLLLPAYAQGQGTIREGIANDLRDIGSLNPLRCNNDACYWAVGRIFPTLLATDPESQWFGEGTADNGGLAVSWEISPDNKVYTFHLREDAFWTDGTAITAYDYFYNYLAIMSRDFESPYYRQLNNTIEGLVPLDDKTLAIFLRENNCDALPNLNFPIAPAHVFDANFAETASAFFNDGDVREQWAAWQESFTGDFSFMQEHPFDMNPSVTGGVYEFVAYQPYAYIRLRAGDVALELLPVSSNDEEVNLFLNGELTILTHPPQNRWNDILAAEDVQTYQQPSGRWDYIAFNLEDPIEPESAFDEEGQPIVQEPNPYFSDLRVRQAIQLAINVPELIEVGLQGQGSPMSALYSPLDWQYTPTEPYAHDPEAARDLLDEAGWVMQGNNRRCVNCGTAEEGDYLNFELAYGNYEHHYVVASLIAQQLYEVGINVSISNRGLEAAQSQRFALYLGTWGDSIPEIGLDELFLPEADIVGEGLNFTSYNNPAVSELIVEAQTLAGCDLASRAESYQEIERILKEDLPYVWLYSQDERFAVRGSVQNYAPAVGQPFGDMRDWSIFDVPRG